MFDNHRNVSKLKGHNLLILRSGFSIWCVLPSGAVSFLDQQQSYLSNCSAFLIERKSRE